MGLGRGTPSRAAPKRCRHAGGRGREQGIRSDSTLAVKVSPFRAPTTLSTEPSTARAGSDGTSDPAPHFSSLSFPPPPEAQHLLSPLRGPAFARCFGNAGGRCPGGSDPLGSGWPRGHPVLHKDVARSASPPKPKPGSEEGHGLPLAQGLPEPVNGAPRLLRGQARLAFSPFRDTLGYPRAQCSGRASAAQSTAHQARPRLGLGKGGNTKKLLTVWTSLLRACQERTQQKYQQLQSQGP